MLSFILFFVRYFRHTAKEDSAASRMEANNLSLFWIVTLLVMISSLIPKLVSYVSDTTGDPVLELSKCLAFGAAKVSV